MVDLRSLKTRNMIALPLDIEDVMIQRMQQNQKGDYIITLASTLKGTTCQHCGRQLTKFYGHGRWITLRHLSILGGRTYLHLRPKQYECRHCEGQITTQDLSWYQARSPHTHAYDKHLMKQLIGSTVAEVSRKEDVGYDAVQGAIQRRLQATVNWEEFDDLTVIGIDEVALTKGRRNFIAVITTQQADGQVAVLAVLPDRKKTSVRQFLETIPPRLRRTMATVCIDMWTGYASAVQAFAAAHPDVTLQIVVDRYHVAKNYRECVDDLRKRERRRLKQELSEAEYDELVKGTMWITRKNNADLDAEARDRLNRLFAVAPQLKLAYTFREELTAIFEMPLTRKAAQQRLQAWAAKVRRSPLTCFDSFLTTLDNWGNEILNYFVNRLNSGFVEGLNNKLKSIKRRCYGITRVITLFQRLYLDTQGHHYFA